MRVRDLGMELDAPAAVTPFQGDRYGILIRGNDPGVGGKICAGVAVAHPDLGLVRDAFEQIGMIGDDKLGRTILTGDTGLHGAAMLDVQELHAIAHAENRHIKGHELFKIDIRRVLFRRAARTTGKDNGPGVLELGQFGGRVEMRDKAQLADAADDELAVLGSVIKYGNFVIGHGCFKSGK